MHNFNWHVADKWFWRPSFYGSTALPKIACGDIIAVRRSPQETSSKTYH
jgi:hypothetical protein